MGGKLTLLDVFEQPMSCDMTSYIVSCILIGFPEGKSDSFG